MTSPNYDVVVVGAGAAGLAAAIGLARAGFAVAAVEAGAFPGAENWSGCVYFCENLAHPDLLGPEGVEALAWERRLVERGFFASDGHGLLGVTYRDPEAFRHCYTVLRPLFDHHLAQVALRHGVALLCNTTAESLIRDNGEVVGVSTSRGPLYADLTFLAEGDASHLVTREGYERFADRRDAPKFLQGIKQVIDLPPGAIEEVFGVGPEEGVAYEMLLRNGTLRGRTVRLNMGGFVYTNRQSLSVGLVLPADHLRDSFDGDPNLLLQWFANLPALRPWMRNGQPGVFGAKLIRGGGARDIPTLIDHGLAVGGAASAIGIDFPYPNFTGPATAMGLLLVRAACRIRAEGGRFTADDLRRHYLEPLQATHYWQDVTFLRRWPGYVKKTRVFFEDNLDLSLGSAYLWTRPRRWLLTKWTNWIRLLLHVAGPGRWRTLRTDLRHLIRALRLPEVTGRPALGRLLLDGTVNALRDFFGSPRANVPPAGLIRLHYTVAGGAEPVGPAPAALHRWFQRFAPVLASAACKVYTNDDLPLAAKLPGAFHLLLRQLNMLDLLAAASIGLAAGVCAAVQVGWDRFVGLLHVRRPQKPRLGLYASYAQAMRRATDLTPAKGPAAQHWEARLATLAYQTVKDSHLHVLWPKGIKERKTITADGLWHVCPARVYEARVSPTGQPQVVVNFENCIKCETCWRTSDRVDWGRDGRHGFVYAVHSPVVGRLLEAVEAAGLARPVSPRCLDWWEPSTRKLTSLFQTDPPRADNPLIAGDLAEVGRLLTKLERKLEAFDEALAEEPRTIDPSRAEYLEMLARYAQQLAARVLEVLRGSDLAYDQHFSLAAAYERILHLAGALAGKAEERARRTWNQHFAWAAADGRQLRQHHLVGLRRFTGVLAKHLPEPAPPVDPTRQWLRAEEDTGVVAEQLAAWAARLDAVFGPSAWRDLERQASLTPEQAATLQDLIGHLPRIDRADLAATLHPPLRKALLAELGRRDPSLAYRVASHLWARDLVALTSDPSFTPIAERWLQGDAWACFVPMDAVQSTANGRKGEALLIPTAEARAFLLFLGEELAVVSKEEGGQGSGLRIEPLATLGFRGAGLARVRLEGSALPTTRAAVDRDEVRRVWTVLSAADLTSIAFGMADQLCRRAIAQATNRVQFPGLFQDEQARDTIGKFGAVKKMVAEMAARRYLIETLDHALSPPDFSAASVEQSGLIKVLVAEALGTAPGSVTYNAGQIFGGTGFSEDDILAKFYRDAATLRFLGPASADVYQRHGQDLLHGWRPDGQRLASLRDEVEYFDQVAQRKALQAELDEVRVARSRLRSVVGDWLAACGPGLTPNTPGDGPDGESLPAPSSRNDREDRMGAGRGSIPPAAAGEVREGLGRQNAHLLASKALLLRTHARLEHGLPAQTEVALVRVWLEQASVSLEEFEGMVRRFLDPAGRRDDRPVVEPSAGPPVAAYADYLAAPCPYDSGDFLSNPVDLVQPRFVPEMVEADPGLASRNRELRELLSGRFGQPRDGLPYERYIELRHRPDPADLSFCREHGLFRMAIPRDLGGEGRPKVDYYLLITTAQRLADVAVSLTIQVNTSIGTTPVLLARDKDLPKAQKELAAFRENTALQAEVRSHLKRLLEMVALPEPKRMQRSVLELNKRLAEAVLNLAVFKSLAHRFVESWHQVCRAGQEADLEAVRNHLEKALTSWEDACARAMDFQGELDRRRAACELFLRWIASGQISAFALTEPSAGSDTARVATRAQPRSVVIEEEPDGALRFVPAGGQEPRYLLDATKLEFRGDGVFYRWSESAEPAPIRFDEYDYETDAPDRMRYYDHGGRRIHFSDIAHPVGRDGRRWYDYWELTGSKMWITNGRMAGVLCLYAKTEEGVTGFLVDRHAEGLTVGKDEAKLGQCGSPTNEVALQAVRVPRDNVLGLEGRGQVNALETLNVGRAGLAMSAAAQMEGIIERSRAFARSAFGVLPEWVQWRLDQMGEDRFIAEALAYEVVGRFEHPQTKAVRMESAIAKMLVSELLHRMIEAAEEIHGPEGQTQAHLVEKRKRDARVLTIYEGTNEVQRFFVLKDLAAEVAPRWSRNGPSLPPQHLGREALELEALKASTRQRIQAALDVFGQELWQNPNLQANCFLLAEAAAWLKAADSTLGRLAWLSRSCQGEEDADPPAKLQVGRRALARCGGAVRERLRRFDEELTHLRRGYYAPEIRAAELLFGRAAEPAPSRPPSSQITRPFSVLVGLEPSAAPVPQPHVAGGRLLEAHLSLHDGDRSALEVALRLRDEARGAVTVQVAAVGPKGAAQVLREALSLGVDRARLVVWEADMVPPDSAAAALAAVLGRGASFDLVLGGGSEPDGEEGLVARLTAERLGVPYTGDAVQLVVKATGDEASVLLSRADNRQQGARDLPAATSIQPGIPLRTSSVQGYLAGLSKVVETEHWPKAVKARQAFLVEESQAASAAAAEAEVRPLTPQEASRQVLHEIGLRGKRLVPLQASYEGVIEDYFDAAVLEGGVVVVLAADTDGRLQPAAATTLRAGQTVAQAQGIKLTVLLLVPQREPVQRRAAAQVLEVFKGTVILLSPPGADGSAESNSRVLRVCWPLLGAVPRVVVGEPWAESALASLGCRGGPSDLLALRVKRLSVDEGEVILETSRARGKLVVRQKAGCRPGTTSWIGLALEAEASGGPVQARKGEPRVLRWEPRLERHYGAGDVARLLSDVKADTGLVRLSDADFIIDVGFGVGNRDGYEAVIEPLERALRELGVRSLAVGGSRKVTEELHLLPVDRQIGQSGVSVNPRLLLAIGISGAPQHVNYIGPRAVVLAFNRDPEAPLLTLNRRQARPRVYPVVGNLFETVPALIAALRQEQSGTERPEGATPPAPIGTITDLG